MSFICDVVFILFHCRIQKNVASPVQMPTTDTPVQLNHKVVDFRKEKAFLKDMAYLTR